LRIDLSPAALFLAPILVACKTSGVQVEVPALLASPGIEVRQELQLAVSNALHGVPIVLANDALTRSSLLIVEQRPVRNLDQQPATGRMLGLPEQFRLLRRSEDCVLLHLGTATRTVLKHAECVAEVSPAVNGDSLP
jgi:hypothetical protein